MSRVLMAVLIVLAAAGIPVALAGCQQASADKKQVRLIPPALHQQIRLTRSTVHVPQ